VLIGPADNLSSISAVIPLIPGDDMSVRNVVLTTKQVFEAVLPHNLSQANHWFVEALPNIGSQAQSGKSPAEISTIIGNTRVKVLCAELPTGTLIIALRVSQVTAPDSYPDS
jgi:hypothetical protein